jgi:hypothetical protein
LSLDFGEQAVGKTQPPRLVTLTNTAHLRVTIYKLQMLGEIAHLHPCLSEDGTCTITVTFTPQEADRRNVRIDLPNSFGQTSSVLLSGTGI